MARCRWAAGKWEGLQKAYRFDGRDRMRMMSRALGGGSVGQWAGLLRLVLVSLRARVLRLTCAQAEIATLRCGFALTVRTCTCLWRRGDAILDERGDAVMMEWERPLMEAHAGEHVLHGGVDW